MQIFKPEFDSYFHLLKIMVINLRQRKQKFNSPSNENHKTVFFICLLLTCYQLFFIATLLFSKSSWQKSKVSNTFIVLIPRRGDREIVPLKFVSFRYFAQDVALA